MLKTIKGIKINIPKIKNFEKPAYLQGILIGICIGIIMSALFIFGISILRGYL